MRHQRTPAGQPRPAQIADGGLLHQRHRMRPHVRPGVEDHAVGERGDAVQRLFRAAAPPDERRKTREPQRRHRVVDE